MILCVMQTNNAFMMIGFTGMHVCSSIFIFVHLILILAMRVLARATQIHKRSWSIRITRRWRIWRVSRNIASVCSHVIRQFEEKSKWDEKLYGRVFKGGERWVERGGKEHISSHVTWSSFTWCNTERWYRRCLCLRVRRNESFNLPPWILLQCNRC
jgi:hypothetical protein